MRYEKLSMDDLSRKTVDEYKKTCKLPLVVVLDNLRSLHNIGSIFRTCDAFLVEAIYLCGISATPPHKEIHKSALGAEQSVDWKYFETTMLAINFLQTNNYELWGVEQTQSSISPTEITLCADKRVALIFGNEVRGIDQEIIDRCNGCIEIPQFGTKHSFNVSVSAGIVLWEYYKLMCESKFIP